jgi:hypothetical protein
MAWWRRLIGVELAFPLSLPLPPREEEGMDVLRDIRAVSQTTALFLSPVDKGWGRGES